MSSLKSRVGKVNPFSGTSEFNPLTSLDTLKLVDVPAAPETHERRQMRRNYLSGTGGPLDNLFNMLDGKQPQTPRKIEVTRAAKQPEDDESGQEASPPRFGR